MELHRGVEACLRRTVDVVCDLLGDDIERQGQDHHDEAALRIELVACVLSSQVTASAVEVAIRRLLRDGLLSDERWAELDASFERDVSASLRGRSDGLGSYRFPQAKAAQIAHLRTVLREVPLTERLDKGGVPRELRLELVDSLPGVGPKQASMFLRNVGVSYDLAILDVHVLNFLHQIGLLPSAKIPIASVSQYEEVEVIAKQYAKTCQHEVGYLDWAIWITMQALKELRS